MPDFDIPGLRKRLTGNLYVEPGRDATGERLRVSAYVGSDGKRIDIWLTEHEADALRRELERECPPDAVKAKAAAGMAINKAMKK